MKIKGLLPIIGLLLTILCNFQAFGEEEKTKIFVSPDQQLKKIERIDYSGERASLINWSEIKEEEFLSIREWKKRLRLKEKTPKWRQNLQERRLREKVGFVLECVGECRLYRGLGYAKVDYLSTIREGDEILTMKNSYLWAYLLDGTLVRMSPDGSLSLKEINIGKEENFIFARLNAGNILWWSRDKRKYESKIYKETDTLFLPLSMYVANPKDASTKIREDDLFAYLSYGEGHEKKYTRLNQLIEESNKNFSKDTLSFLVMPNGTVMGKNLVAEFIVLTGNSSYVKIRDDKQVGLAGDDDKEDAASFYYRGFRNTKTEDLAKGTWYEIDPKGRSISQYENTKSFAMGEFITKNIPSILIARELFFQKYSKFFHEDLTSRELAEKYGYRLWTSSSDSLGELFQRISFLKEYTRRIETTNLLVAEQFKKKLEQRGETWTYSTYNPSYYQRAMGNFYNYREGVSILSERKESLNSERKPFWKKIHGIRE